MGKIRTVADIRNMSGPDISQMLMDFVDIKDALAEVEYRHACLKSIVEDEKNFRDEAEVDKLIDDFISEEESHS